MAPSISRFSPYKLLWLNVSEQLIFHRTWAQCTRGSWTGHIGRGGGKIHVLVKRLGMKTCPALRVRFANELCSLAKLRHRNLVQLRGAGARTTVRCSSSTTRNLLSHHLLVRRRDTLLWRGATGTAS
jgi:hypothetical protein